MALQRQCPASSLATLRARNGSSARVSVGAAAAYPSVNRSANASSRTSTTRGGSGPGGAARAASAASSTPPGLSRSAGPHRSHERLQVHLARQSASSGSRRLAALEEQPSSVADALLIKRDLPAEVLHLGGPRGVKRASLDRDEQPECRVERAGVALRPGRREHALSTANGFGRQHRRALEERGRRGQASAALRLGRPSARARRRRPRGTRRGLGAVPGMAVGIDIRIGDVRKGTVHVLSLLK